MGKRYEEDSAISDNGLGGLQGARRKMLFQNLTSLSRFFLKIGKYYQLTVDWSLKIKRYILSTFPVRANRSEINFSDPFILAEKTDW